ncbi:MAG: hypothetical protein Q9160_007160 [Pyrenula sp. 1 TL-2023]
MYAALLWTTLLPFLRLTPITASPVPQTANPAAGCNKLLTFFPDCSGQAERLFPTDINAQNNEAINCILDNTVTATRAQRINVTYPIEFIKPVTQRVDNGAIILYNQPPNGVQPLPVTSALFTIDGQPNGNSVAVSLRYWRNNGYVLRVPGKLTLSYDAILSDIFTNGTTFLRDSGGTA